MVSCLAAAIAATNVYAMSDVPVASTKDPQPIYQPGPEYSLAMRYDEVHGAVKVSFLVDSRGNVTDPVVVRANDARLAKSALDAVRHWKFKPALRDGEPIARRVVQTIDFPVFDPAGR
ncbi:MAG TPA: energy transducer TonB [Opitutaceae bacterium]